MFGMSWHEMLIVGVIAILLFGKRLPEVAKSLGNSYREFKRGLAEFHSQVDFTDSSSSPSSSNYASTSRSYPARDPDDYEEATAPRFEPPPSEPTSGRDFSPPSGDINRPIGER
ncbi:MAG: twin-arginine translocase TatA/TatE family subunit [Pirellulales bacterium]